MRIVLYCLAALILYQVLIRAFRKMFHFPAPAIVGRFLDSKLRRSMQRPGTLIRRSGFEPGMRVLEIGCGSGAYTLDVSQAVGSAGKVFALDVQPEMLAQLEAKLTRSANRHIQNIEPVRGSAGDLPFDDQSIDAVYMVTVLQEVPDKAGALREARRVLAWGGRIAVTEWLVDPDFVPRGATERLLRQAQFTNVRTEGNLWTYTTVGDKR